MTISESIIASATEGDGSWWLHTEHRIPITRELISHGAPGDRNEVLKVFLNKPIGEEHAKSIRENLGTTWAWVNESTTRRELDSFSAEYLESLKNPQVAEPMTSQGQDYHLYNGAEALVPEPMTDLERAARAICVRLGWDPDCIAYATPVHQTHVADRAYVFTLPVSEHAAPLWTFFTAEAEAALSVLDI